MVKRLLIPLIFLCSSTSFASHIVGGEFNLLYLSPNKYQLNLILYFDAINGFEQLLDQEVNAHIFRFSDDSLMMVKFLPRLMLEDVPYYQETCDFNGIKTTRIIYGDTLTLSDEMYNDPKGYYVAWENCCRNYDVTNANTGNFPVPGSPPGIASGQTYFLAFPSVVQDGQPFVNSSPSLFRALNSFGCVGVPYWADFGGVDSDGDTLLYSLTLPYDVSEGYQLNTTRPAPYPTVHWVGDFGPNNIMGGDPKLSVSKEGILTVTPQLQGLYVFAVQCREVRNGKVIGWAIREFQLFVTDWCEPNFSPVVQGKLANELNYSQASELTLEFPNNISAEDRCVNIQISDQDAAIEEIVEIRAVALNFEGDVGVVLPDTTNAVLQNGEHFNFDICFPECPLIDPLINEYYEIGILALDDACPIPRIDTLIVKVKVAAPANKLPYILSNGQDLELFTKEVTETSGGRFSLPLAGIDPDNQALSLEIIPLGDFDPALAGMGFTSPNHSPGSVSTEFIWDYDCKEDHDFSEGRDVSIDDFSTRKAYDFLILVEDEDQCEFARADTLEMNLMINFPGEAHPNIFKDGGDQEIEYYEEFYEINQTINYSVRALDGIGDSDRLNISAFGQDFELTEYGASFDGVINGQGTSPGSRGVLNWPLKCDLFDLETLDLFTILFVVTDIDECNLANTDTLMVDFKIEDRINTSPELSFINIPGAAPIIDNTLKVDYLTSVDFQVLASDSPEDTISLSIGSITGTKNLTNYTFTPIGGTGSVTGTFNMALGCELLDGLEAGEYNISFIAHDFACKNTAADTLELRLTVVHHEEGEPAFVAPNVFTPNGDGINDSFSMLMYDPDKGQMVDILPLNDCEGSFEEIIIYNRWGAKIYSSKNRNFQWDGEGSVAGVYYYSIRYTHLEYNGMVSMLY